jgi:hypothetical protein
MREVFRDGLRSIADEGGLIHNNREEPECLKSDGVE